MKKKLTPIRLVDKIFANLGLGMRAKLISLFVVIKVIPLILLALLAVNQSLQLGHELQKRTLELTIKANEALSDAGQLAVNDAMSALDNRATEDIERMTTDTAANVASFLYGRDDDIRFLALLEPNADLYRGFANYKRGLVVKPQEWILAPDQKSWIPKNPQPTKEIITSSIEENELNFHYRADEGFHYEARPLYLEITFVDLNGQEKIKITTSDQMDSALKDISDHNNTYVKAERYFEDLKKLDPGEIYVSEVIGVYTPSKIIGIYTPAAAEAKGIPYEPETAAYAGRENPVGTRFKGIVRWATPVVRNNQIAGYVTIALDHDHIMEFTDHIMPTSERYTELPDAYEGNYAFIWDYMGRSICHPRHHSITGYDPATGDPEVPWLEDRIYNNWRTSGLSYVDFIKGVPTFMDQSRSKKPAAELTTAGLVGLDCRYLNNAPQCTGWFDLTQEGGSGSFVILWSGLRKLTTAAAIPYYTGRYGQSPRGFGFVTIGAGLEYFHRPAVVIKEEIDKIITASNQELADDMSETQEAIDKNLWNTTASLTTSTIIMGLIVILIAIWMASVFTHSITRMINGISRFRAGERQFRFNAPVKDEMGALADSFDDMADSLVESVKEPMAITDLYKTILYMNDEWLQMIDKSLDNVVGQPYDNHRFVKAGSDFSPIAALLNDKEPKVFYYAPTDNYLRGQASYLTNKEGESIGYIITITDVTEIAKAQKQTEEQRAILDTVFTASPDLIWLKDAAGYYLTVNPRFASMIGLPPEELTGTNAEALFVSENAKRFGERDRNAIRKRGAWFNEELLHFADGHTETVDAVRTPLFDNDGNLVGLLGVARDVSGRVAVENELRNTQIELEKAVIAANQANESKSVFLARMSHEIRTPMNAIVGMTNITKRKLEEDNFEKEQVIAHVRQIEISSKHLLGLLNDILDISKIEAGKIELSEESFNLRKLVDNVAAIINPRCTEKNINFVTTVEGLTETAFISDALRLRQVLINLLGNAVKFTNECGEINFTVMQKAAEDSRVLLEFSVKDTGIGIAPETITSLFKPFEQGGVNINRQYGGTGLGLSISNSIINLIGGEIRVDSTPGVGSIFHFEIWLPKANEEKDEHIATANVGNMKGRRILLIDDVDINRMIVVEMLNSTGIIIDEAENGIAGIDLFKGAPEGFYDLVFMDIQMPGMNGYEAASLIRCLDRPDAMTVPIVAMTANAFQEDVDKALAHGMNSHLAKPLDFEKIMEILAKYFKGPKKTNK